MALLLDDRQQALVAEVERRRGEDLLGLVLSGSVARGMATERSDLDLHVVLTDEAAAGEVTSHSAEIDEIPDTLTELEDVSPYGSPGWWFRWSYAYAVVLRDDTGGRITAAVRRLATVDAEEQHAILVDHSRLDGFVNFAYRAWPGACGPTTSTSRGSCASTRSRSPSGPPRPSCRRSSGCWPATRPRCGVPSPSSTARCAPGTPRGKWCAGREQTGRSAG